jgi:hypothetical protein
VQTHKRLLYINNLELFKLAAINMPKCKLLPLMPIELQVESIDVNRMRSKYITLIMGVWKAYTKFIFNSTCTIMGTFTDKGEMVPGHELCDACTYEQDEEKQVNPYDYPPVDYSKVAQMAGYGNE